MKDMWDGRDLSVRSKASIWSKVKCIREGSMLLSEFEKREIERRVRSEMSAGQTEGSVNSLIHSDVNILNEFSFPYSNPLY